MKTYKEFSEELNEGQQRKLAKGKKVEVVSGNGVTKVLNLKTGDVIASGDFDSGVDAWFLSMKGERGQKAFDTAKDIANFYDKKV